MFNFAMPTSINTSEDQPENRNFKALSNVRTSKHQF